MRRLKSLGIIISGMIIISIFISGIFMAGCSTAGSVKKTEIASSQRSLKKSETEVKQEAKIIKFMAGMPGSASMRAAEIFAKDLEEKTKGELKVELFKTGDLGNQKDLMEGVSKGTVEMSILPPSRFQVYDSRFSKFSYSFMLWEGLEQADEFRRTDEYVEMKSSLENKFGIKIMGMYSSGQRHIWTGNKQVVLPMDLKNLKIRVSELDDSIEQGKSLQMQVYQAFGAYPLYVPLSDVTAGIRSGVIDGMDGNAADIITNRLSKVIRHCVLTNHAITIMVPVLSVKTWKSLTPDQQKVLESEMERYETNVREIMLKGEVDYIDKLEEEGITFTTLTDQQHMQYKSIINSTVKNYIMSTGNNIGGSGK